MTCLPFLGGSLEASVRRGAWYACALEEGSLLAGGKSMCVIFSEVGEENVCLG